MKRPGFFRGVIAAAVLAIGASAFVAAFIPFLGTVTVARLVIPGLAFAYLLYLLPMSGERVGRVTTFSLWSLMAIGAWLFVPSFSFYVLIHVGALWLIRSLYFYSGIVPSLMDIVLSGGAAIVALGTMHRTGSVFLATWAFFLLQALFVTIPASLRKKTVPVSPPERRDDGFERSRRQAEAALKQLVSQ